MQKPTKQCLDAYERLKAELRIRGTSLAQSSRDLGVSDPALTLVEKGFHRSLRIERALADAFGSTPQALFTDRYEEANMI